MGNPDLVASLIRTQALRLAPPDEVFWYTSGTVGPYYINTHYLFGGPEPAQALLEFIDVDKLAPDFAPRLLARCEAACVASEEYRFVIDALVEHVQTRCGNGDFDCVSGGERRDWFFSAIVAARLQKPHLFMYKDGHAMLWWQGEPRPQTIDSLQGMRSIHVADLVTEASSYLRAWVPAMRQRGGEMVYALNVVDRAQGGSEAIEGVGVPAAALLRVDEELFQTLRAQGLVGEDQFRTLSAYHRDPEGAMRRFLREHPGFVERALRSQDERTSSRAKLLVEGNLYGLGSASGE